MKEKYFLMGKLQKNFERLVEQCGVQSEMSRVVPVAAPLKWLEQLFPDESLYSYLEEMNALTLQATEKMKGIKLECWCNQENEKRLEEMEEQLQRQEVLLEQEKDACKKLKEELLQAKNAESKVAQEQKKMILGMITMRDHLLMKKRWLESYPSDGADTEKLIDSQLDETANLLKELGVEILEDKGVFDSYCHTVVGTKPTSSEEMVDQIAETSRPGYRFCNEMLRSQEVVLYRKG